MKILLGFFIFIMTMNSSVYAQTNSIYEINQYLSHTIKGNFAFSDDRGKSGYGHFYYKPEVFILEYEEPNNVVLTVKQNKVTLFKNNVYKEYDIKTHPLYMLTNYKKSNVSSVKEGKNSYQIDVTSKQNNSILKITFANLGGEIKFYNMKLYSDEKHWTLIDFTSSKIITNNNDAN
jgi:hypothetical protein